MPFESRPAPVPEVPELTVRIEEMDETYGKFVAEPLERGWGATLGNPLRRALLNSLPGAAITWAKIDGVLHEYSTLPGMREEVGEFLLNLKGLRIRPLADRPGRLRLEIDGEGEVRGGDMLNTADFEIVNPGHHLATLDSPKARLSVEMNVEQGTGYRATEPDDGLPIGTLAIDAVFTPIRKANFTVESTRVASRDDMERLTVEVWTDRTLTPAEALQGAARRLIDRLHKFVTLNERPAEEPSELNPHDLTAEQFNRMIETLGLSARTLNCLRRYGLKRVGEVAAMRQEELLKIRGFGKSSLNELYDIMLGQELLSYDPRDGLSALTDTADDGSEDDK
jgi:DNA-directed RNA polymerase subunit alpha